MKKYSLFLNIVLLVPLCLGLVAVAAAQSQGVCSINRLAGQLGYTTTGTIFVQTVPEQFAAIGKITVHADGTVTSLQNASLGGSASHETFAGPITINPDCTGTMTVDVTDETGTLPNRTVTWALVFDDKTQEMRGLVKTLVLHFPAGDQDAPAVVTMNARKVLPGSANAQ